MSDETNPVPDNWISLEWADGDYDFRLPVGQLAELQTKCDAGIGKIYSRLMAGRYKDQRTGEIILNPLQADLYYQDITEVIRLALIGGGKGIVNGEVIEVTPTKAQQLIRDYVHTRPLLENWKVASAIVNAFMIGYSDPAKAQKKSPPQAAGVGPVTEQSTSVAS